MKKVFVDTNIIIDLLADRAPFARFTIELFDSAEKEKVKLFASTHSFATTYYLLKKFFEEKELRKLFASLLDYLELISVDTDIIKKKVCCLTIETSRTRYRCLLQVPSLAWIIL
jgi:predicted nucleic acid-binding protein